MKLLSTARLIKAFTFVKGLLSKRIDKLEATKDKNWDKAQHREQFASGVVKVAREWANKKAFEAAMKNCELTKEQADLKALIK